MSCDFGYAPRKNQESKPVKLGEEYEVTIQDISWKGEGVTWIKGFIVLVPHAKAGEKLRIRITKAGSRYAEAEHV